MKNGHAEDNVGEQDRRDSLMATRQSNSFNYDNICILMWMVTKADVYGSSSN